MNQKLRKILETYGLRKQLKYFQSEIYELNEAILSDLNSGSLENVIDNVLKTFAPILNINYIDKNREHVKEEIADVMVMLKQFQLFYGISSQEIKDTMRYKINRQIEKIEKEKTCNGSK